MLLLIDAGNTRIKWALAAPHAAPGEWFASGAVGHADSASLGGVWEAAPICSVLISNVAGATVQALLDAQLQRLQPRPLAPVVTWFAASLSQGGVQNHYRVPERLGADRFAALIGARSLLPQQALIVATCGTATTIDAISPSGVFVGGLILPGLATMAASLAQRTAQLPDVSAQTVVAPAPGSAIHFADHTEMAISNGCLAAQAGAIERAVGLHGGAHCLLSGGAAAWVGPALSVPFTRVDNLVLIGLHAAALASQPPSDEPESTPTC